MQISELIELLERPEIARLAASEQRDSIASLIHGLRRIQHLDLAALVAATHTVKLPTTKRTKTTPSATSVIEAVEALRRLKDDVRDWRTPDYPEVRRRVNGACAAFRKDDVVEICRAFLGKTHSGKSKGDLLEALAQPMIRQLEIRFMNAGA